MALEITHKAMEIDAIVAPIPPKRTEGHQRAEELTIHTPPQGTRKPAKMRLSVGRKQRDITDNELLEEEFPLTDRKRALFEPLGPSVGLQPSSPDMLLPPPDFDTASYPRGWVIGKKRKLVNVDVVESMRRIAVQEMNRKDREITDLNEQLEEDSRTMEHLQLQLQQERSKRAQIERENCMLQGQVSMLMTMIPDAQEPEDGETFET